MRPRLVRRARTKRRRRTGRRLLQKGNRLLQLESRYPYGRYAQQAQLELGCLLQDKEPASAPGSGPLHQTPPDNPSVDYAYYLKGW